MSSALDGLADTAVAPHATQVSTAPHGSNAAPMLGPGATLGRYRLVAQLGAGGMGVVFRAHDPNLARDVAIKILRGAPTEDRRQRLIREAQAMARVKHRNLVTVYDAGEQDAHVFLAMELVEGGSLRDWMKDATRSQRVRLAAIDGAACGLAAAHAAGLVHRDFKPENVLVSIDGTMRVADFGLATADPSAERPGHTGDVPAVDLTITGSLVGTPSYMSPEQHAGDVADARSDQFALAVVAWEVLWGQRPFRGDTYQELAAAVTSGTIVPPPRRGGTDGRLERVLRRALAVDPAARFASVEALRAALHGAAARAKWPVAFASLVTIVLLGTLAVSQRGGSVDEKPGGGPGGAEGAEGARHTPSVVAPDEPLVEPGSGPVIPTNKYDGSGSAALGSGVVSGDVPDPTAEAARYEVAVDVHRTELAGCFGPRGGKIAVQLDLTVAADGRIVDVADGGRLAPQVLSCVRRTAGAWSDLPRPPKAFKLQLRWPR